MCSACCGNLLILLLDGLACCLACCFVLLAFRRPLVFICSLHSLPGVRWFHSCLWWLGCLERGFVRASGGWLRVVVGSVCFSPLFGLGWLWFLRLSSGLRPACCGLLRGQVTAPQRSCAVYLGKFMDKVMMVHLTCHVTVVFHHCVKACQRLGVAFHGRSFAINIYSPVHVQLLLLWPCPCTRKNLVKGS